MQQLELKFFWPLTEQIPLDLDYQPPIYTTSISPSVTTLTIPSPGINGIITATRPQYENSNNSVGYWQITESFRVYRDTKPTYIVRKVTQLLLGWDWKDTR